MIEGINWAIACGYFLCRICCVCYRFCISCASVKSYAPSEGSGLLIGKQKRPSAPNFLNGVAFRALDSAGIRSSVGHRVGELVVDVVQSAG